MAYLEEKSGKIRKQILTLSNRAKSAHAGSSLSCVEIITVLFSLKYPEQKDAVMVNRFLLSKGHAAMALYAGAYEFGLLEEKHLLNYMKNYSQLWGHPSRSENFPFISWSTGSLGHGLAIVTGWAYSQKLLAKEKSELLEVALLSDGECDEGSIWEAALFAAHHKLRNLVAIIDYNKIQSFGRCEEVMSLEPFSSKWKSFGWEVKEVDGHSCEEIEKTIREHAADLNAEKPLAIIAHTVKGKGVKEIEDTIACHYKPITEELLKKYL